MNLYIWTKRDGTYQFTSIQQGIAAQAEPILTGTAIAAPGRSPLTYGRYTL